MLKWTTFATQTDDGQPLIRIVNGDLEKIASYRPELQEYLGTFEKQANKTYVLVNAMTAGEYFGPNLNGDYFAEPQLQTYHKTFEKYAYAYRHHVNKDPEKSAGKVIFSTYHPDMHRVELVIELDNDKGADIIERINKGEFPAVSMGTRTPSDKCSICGNRAKNTAAYCNHLKYEMRRVLPDGRRVMAINDDRLTFFDISFVRIPADRTASVITKVAHVHDEDEKAVIPSAVIGDEWLKRAGTKEAILFKEVPGTIEGMSKDPEGLIMSSRKPLPKEALDKIANEYSLKDILSTFLAAHIVPTPYEFQRIIIIKMKRDDLLAKAEEAMQHGHHLIDLEEGPQISVDVTADGFNKELLEKISNWIPDSGMTPALIMRRVMEKRADQLIECERVFVPSPAENNNPITHTNLDEPPFPAPKKRSVKVNQKVANMVNITGPLIGSPAFGNVNAQKPVGPRASTYSPEKSPLLALEGLGALYWGFLKHAKEPHSLGTVGRFFKEAPWLVPILMGAVALGSTQYQSSQFDKQAAFDPLLMRDNHFLPRLLTTIPGAYIAAGHQENKLQKGQQISKLEDIVRKHPFLVGTTGLYASGHLLKTGPALWQSIKNSVKLASLDRVVYGLGPEQFKQLYADIIGDSLDTN